MEKRKSTAPTPALEHLASSIRMSIRAAPGEKIPDGNPEVLRRASTMKSMVVANDQRPLDMISLRDYLFPTNPHVLCVLKLFCEFTGFWRMMIISSMTPQRIEEDQGHRVHFLNNQGVPRSVSETLLMILILRCQLNLDKRMEIPQWLDHCRWIRPKKSKCRREREPLI